MSDTLMQHLAAESRERRRTDMAIADDRRYDALLETLAFAVPLRIWELRDRTPEQRAVIARRCGQHVAEHGDALMFRSKKGAAAAAFNALAEGLACAAYQPGGVTFAGRHWCTDHAACLAADRGEPAPTGDCGDAYAAGGARPDVTDVVPNPGGQWAEAL